jgi:hypothetical protein
MLNKSCWERGISVEYIIWLLAISSAKLVKMVMVRLLTDMDTHLGLLFSANAGPSKFSANAAVADQEIRRNVRFVNQEHIHGILQLWRDKF